MSSLTGGALLVLALFQQTDTVVALEGANRLSVEAPGGSVTVTAWDRPEVRVRASHSSRVRVEVSRRGSTLAIRGETDFGPVTIVDYEIFAPSALALQIEGMHLRIAAEGMTGDISAETMQGDVRIVGGRGTIRASSVAGSVHVEGAVGRIEVESVGGPVRVSDSEGEIYVESVGGPITLEGVRARVVEVGTIGGRVQYRGSIEDGGRYFFASHGGSIEVGVPAGANATFTLASLHGTVHSDLPGAPERLERGRRGSFSVGSGSALVEVETFGGRISVIRR